MVSVTPASTTVCFATSIVPLHVVLAVRWVAPPPPPPPVPPPPPPPVPPPPPPGPSSPVGASEPTTHATRGKDRARASSLCMTARQATHVPRVSPPWTCFRARSLRSHPCRDITSRVSGVASPTAWRLQTTAR